MTRPSSIARFVNQRRGRGEDGLALVLALGFLSLMGVLVTSMLTLGFASFKTSEVTQSADDKAYGADGGIDVGVQLLRTNTSYCPNTAAGTQSLPDQTINGRTVHVTCQVINSGSIATPGVPSPSAPWPLIISGNWLPGQDSNFSMSSFKTSTTGTGRTVKVTGGPVMNAGGFTIASGTGLTFEELHQFNLSGTNYCTASKAAALKPTVTPGPWTCESSGFAGPPADPAFLLSTYDTPGVVATARASVTIGSCTIYFPGKYTTANKPTFSSTGDYYFASGNYYFEDVGTLAPTGDVFGGQPGSPDAQQLTGVTPCSNDAALTGYSGNQINGYGVEFVFGGNSVFAPPSSASSKVELFSRQPPTGQTFASQTAGITFFQLEDAFASGPCPGTNCQKASTVPAVIAPPGNANQLVFHGLVFANRAALKIVATPNGTGNPPMFSGGLITGSLEIVTNSTSVSNSTFAKLPPSGTAASQRTVMVTATADPIGAGEASTVTKAVVQLSVTPGGVPTIQSWRKV